MSLPSAPSHPRRLVYLGTPAMAVPPLEALHAAGFEIAQVVTGPDKRRGRGSTATGTPVKQAAESLGLPVSHDLADLDGLDVDLGVVVAYGSILRRPLLEQLPMVNLHFSLLPRWRGAAPVERAILAGDDRTGVCVMAVEEGLDTGGVYARLEVPVDDKITAADLGRQLTVEGSALLVRALTEGLNIPEPQVGETTYAAKLHSEDLRLDFAGSAVQASRVVRVGGAWTTFRSKRFKVHAAEALPTPGAGSPGTLHDLMVTTGEGALRLLEVQPEGKPRMDATTWANGYRPEPGEVLGA